MIPQEIDPLPAIDHSDITYQPFERNFYKPHEEIDMLTLQQVTDLREKLGVKVGMANKGRQFRWCIVTG